MTSPLPAHDLELPPLQTAVVDERTLKQLFFDVANQAELLAVAVRPDTGLPTTLAEALARLLESRSKGVQLRYLHSGSEWRDTILSQESGFRLVRIQHPRGV